MKTIKWDEKNKKKCDFCGEVAIYDAPTRTGTWAYMCEKCHKSKGGMNFIGTKFDYRPVAKPKAKLAVGIEASSLEEQVTGDRNIQCPDCGDLRLVEPDADYNYNCEGCGVKVQVPMGLC